jgi:hypothetical protein
LGAGELRDIPAKPDEALLSDFAALADQLGFQSDQISALKQRSSDREIARVALLNARKPDRYEHQAHHCEEIDILFKISRYRYL